MHGGWPQASGCGLDGESHSLIVDGVDDAPRNRSVSRNAVQATAIRDTYDEKRSRNVRRSGLPGPRSGKRSTSKTSRGAA